MTARGMLLSGAAESTKFKIRISGIEGLCRAIAATWTELLLKKNHKLTRDDLTFIMQQVENCAFTQARNIADAMAMSEGARAGVLSPDYWMKGWGGDFRITRWQREQNR